MEINKEVLRVAPDYGNAQNLSVYGWSAVAFAIGAMLIYIGALMCSHLSAFRIQANMRSKLMRHILTLPLGFMDEEGSGKVRRLSMNQALRQKLILHTSFLTNVLRQPHQSGLCFFF